MNTSELKKPFIIALLAIIIFGCSEDSSVQPPPLNDPFASCGNDEPIHELDSIMGYWPEPTYGISRLTISPHNGWWAGEYKQRIITDGWISYESGIFVYDPVSGMAVALYKDACRHEWSPDGRKLLLVKNYDLFIVDLPGMDLRRITDGESDRYFSSFACWSADGGRIYASQFFEFIHALATYEMKPDGSEKRLVTDSVWNARKLDNTRLLSVLDGNVELYDLVNGGIVRIRKPEISKKVSSYDISPNGDNIVFHVRDYGDQRNHTRQVLVVMDTKTWTMRKIRGSQHWDMPYSPTWASGSTIYASVFCRRDSSNMVWEFDLHGNPIRQITTKAMKM